MKGAGSSSLLRPPAILVASVAVPVVVLVCAIPAHASGRTARTPDPAPAPFLDQPDPYPSPSSPPVTAAPVTPVEAVSGSGSRGTISSATTRRDAADRAASRGAARAAAKRRAARADRLSEMAAGIFAIPDHPAPRLDALAGSPGGPIRRIPVGVALAIALLVLFSSALLAGVSRAVAR